MKRILALFLCVCICAVLFLPGVWANAETDEVTVQFDPGEFGKLSSKHCCGSVGTKIGILPVPVNKTLQSGEFNHLYFDGWYLNGERIDENYILTEDVTLQGHWQPGEYNHFNDVPTEAWYADSVAYCVETKLVAGTGETTFSPAMPCSRAMVVTMLYRMAGSPETSENRKSFSDVSDASWYTDAVLWAAGREIISGVGEGKFAPDAPVTREQLACIITRYAVDCALGDPHSYQSLSTFPDQREVSNWAEKSMQWMVGSELISGKKIGDTVFLDPASAVSRAEIVQVLMAYRRLTDCAMTFFSLPYAVTVPSRWQGAVTARRCENGVELFAVKPGRTPSSLCSVLFTKKETSGELFGRMYSNKDDSVVCDVVFVLSPLSVSEGSPMEALCAAMLAMRRELALYSHASYFVPVP